MEVNAVLAQIRSMQSQIRSTGEAFGNGPGALAAGGSAAAPSSFSSLLAQGVKQVDQAQKSAASMATAFEKGVPGVELPQVMIELQKASVSLRAMTEVRNRFVSAYQEIMNMPI
jgi:flagellar hook-basal body complex protein FliE